MGMSTQIIALPEVRIDPNKLREARGERVQSHVARDVGIDRQRLSDYERGVCDPPADVLARLCILYGIDISHLTNR